VSKLSRFNTITYPFFQLLCHGEIWDKMAHCIERELLGINPFKSQRKQL